MKKKTIYALAAALYLVMAIVYMTIAFLQKQTIHQYAFIFSAAIIIVSGIGFLCVYLKNKSK